MGAHILRTIHYVMRGTMRDLEATTSCSMSSPTGGYSSYTSVYIYISLYIQDNDKKYIIMKQFLPQLYLYIYKFWANYKYSLNRHIGTYLQICSCFRFSSDSVGFLLDPSGPVSFYRFVGSHPEGPVSQHYSFVIHSWIHPLYFLIYHFGIKENS